MTYESLEYSQYLTPLLQHKIRMTTKGKVIRQGQLILYSFRNFTLELYFKSSPTSESVRKTEIPIPFDISKKDNIIELDYSLQILCPWMDPFEIKQCLPGSHESKFFNSKVNIEIIEASN